MVIHYFLNEGFNVIHPENRGTVIIAAVPVELSFVNSLGQLQLIAHADFVSDNRSVGHSELIILRDIDPGQNTV
jgi:hypothetical protein